MDTNPREIDEALKQGVKRVQEELILPTAEKLAEQIPPTGLTGKDAVIKSKILEIGSALDLFLSRIINGRQVLEEEGAFREITMSKKALDVLLDDELLTAQFAQGKFLQDLLELSDDNLVAFYNLAIELFDRQAFVQAGDVFFLLTQLNPTEPSFWYSVGLCEEKQDRWLEAMSAFAVARELYEDDLRPSVKLSECLIQLGKERAALDVLEEGLAKAEELPSQKELIPIFRQKINEMGGAA